MNIDQIGGVEGLGGPEGPDGPEEVNRFEGPEKSEGAGGADKADPGASSDDVDSSDQISPRPEDDIQSPPEEMKHVESIRNLPEPTSLSLGQSEEQIAEMSKGFKAGDEAPLRAMIEKFLNEGI